MTRNDIVSEYRVMGRRRNPTCPRCGLRPKVAGQGYCAECRRGGSSVDEEQRPRKVQVAGSTPARRASPPPPVVSVEVGTKPTRLTRARQALKAAEKGGKPYKGPPPHGPRCQCLACRMEDF